MWYFLCFAKCQVSLRDYKIILGIFLVSKNSLKETVLCCSERTCATVQWILPPTEFLAKLHCLNETPSNVHDFACSSPGGVTSLK